MVVLVTSLHPALTIRLLSTLMTTPIIIVSLVILFIVFSLYKEFVKPVIVFVMAAAILMATGILTPKEAISGFANEQIAVIFILLILSDVIKKSAALDVSIYRLFKPTLSYKAFITRMSFSVATMSAFVNNTPLVALMMPYVYEWARRKGIAPSKVLMPLSMAAIVGGTATLIGTSTNLVVSGLATEAGLPPLRMFDFTLVGFPILIICCIYMIVFASKLLPDRKDALADFKENTREFLVETIIPEGSGFIGKSIDDNKLRSLRGLFIVEIIRGNRTIAPVSPRDVIRSGDVLMFAGDTETIIDLVNDQTDLVIADFADYPKKGKLDVIEVVVTANSTLINNKINQTNFRQSYDAAILAVDRNGEKLTGKVGDIEIRNGDLLLLVAGKEFSNRAEKERDLIIVSKRREINHKDRGKIRWIILAIFFAFVLEAMNISSLFMSLFFITTVITVMGVVSIEDIKRSLDLELMVMLALAIGIGKSLTNSGADKLFAAQVIEITTPLHPILGVIFGLYLVTNILTMFVTNAAAVAITFPVAVATFQKMALPGITITPFLLVIAFASSADFVTPFGYQTNLMVYGPGGYKFIDYIRFGIIPTFIYMALTIFGLAFAYHLI
ncbi:SLC13 family permease [soil metagenome]